MDQFEQAELLAPLLQRVGYALWQLAEAEDAAVSYFVIRISPVRGVGNATAAPILEAAAKQTFGWLIARLREAAALEPALADELQTLVTERNWLVHRAKRENRGVLHRPNEYADLSRRLDKLAEGATDLQGRLANEIEAYVRSTGVPRAGIDAEAERLRREWGYD
jgi:hypothetical protein